MSARPFPALIDEELDVEKRLLGKVAIVTGAGQGIGKGIALRLAREGADVVVAEYNSKTAASTAHEIEAIHQQALTYPIDVSDVGAVRQMVGDVVAEFGQVDILVNNAGVVQTKPMMELAEGDWDWVIDVNQRGLFFCLQAVAAQMIRQLPEELKAEQSPADVFSIKAAAGRSTPGTEDVGSFGKIVNLSSISGRRGRPLSTHYAASKAAIISITQSAALALAPYHINVNAVCPGIVPTPMWDQIDEDRGQLFGAKPGEAMAAFIKTVPLKRAATAEDVAGAVAFFCSSDSDYITGQALNVDGGYEMN
jgi:meso-butanediol dehydrogenase/(S,S)-butanediol dehydrogenase/diacetyl reductase